jgi:hypothetical protein
MHTGAMKRPANNREWFLLLHWTKTNDHEKMDVLLSNLSEEDMYEMPSVPTRKGQEAMMKEIPGHRLFTTRNSSGYGFEA